LMSVSAALPEDRPNVCEAMARSFALEADGPVFALMGGSNMRFLAHLKREGTEIVRVQHENMAVAMADGYFRATGSVGLCSVTGGPGLAQIANALMIASRRGSRLVIMTGDSGAVAESGGLHAMDHRAFVAASGGIFAAVRCPDTAMEDVARAFVAARTTPGPVILNAPTDLQALPYTGNTAYRSSNELIVPRSPAAPAAGDIERAAEVISGAVRPVLLAGRGAMSERAVCAIERLAARTGALVATTYPAKGLFAGNPFDIGVAGPYGSFASAALLSQCDCIVAFGASLGYFTTQDDKLFPAAKVVQVNLDPHCRVADRRPADALVVADAALAAEALADRLGVPDRTHRVERVRVRLAADLRREEIARHPVEVEERRVDPRLLMLELDSALPDDCIVVTSASHSSYFPSRFISGKRSRTFLNSSEFGSIGQGVSTAIGASIGCPERPVVVFEGDGAAIMNIQELHTSVRHGVNLLIIVMNDEAFGSELHRLGDSPEGTELALSSSPDFAAIAAAFGVTAVTVRDLDDIRSPVRRFLDNGGTHLIDARISRRVVRPSNLAAAVDEISVLGREIDVLDS
jgi:acetolactate synthase-1/2/3 large subunit